MPNRGRQTSNSGVLVLRNLQVHPPVDFLVVCTSPVSKNLGISFDKKEQFTKLPCLRPLLCLAAGVLFSDALSCFP